MSKLAARFSETLYHGSLAHEFTQADGAVKGQDNRPMTEPSACAYMVAKEKKAF